MSETQTHKRLTGLTDLLDSLDHAAEQDPVTIQDVLHEIGERSFTPILLAIALILVSPVSGIPGVPTIAGALIVAIAVQGLAGRDHLWLPGFLLRRGLGAGMLRKGVQWLRKPSAFIDRHSHERLRVLTHGPARAMAYLVCILVAITWPALEILPMATSVGAGAIASMVFGLLTHDGLYTMAGYALVGAMVALMARII